MATLTRQVLHASDIAKPAAVWSRVEPVLIVLFLIFFTNGFIQRMVSGEESSDGNPLLRQAWLPAYAMAFVGLYLNREKALSAVMRAPFLSCVVLLTIVSVAWSIDPATTFRRAIGLMGSTAFALYLATRFTWPELLRLLGWTWLVVGTANLISSAVFPAFGQDHSMHEGAWRGYYYEKNSLGGHMASATLVFAVLVAADQRHKMAWIGGLVVSMLLVFGSTSKTALLAMTVGLGIMGAAVLMRRGPRLAIGIIWLSVTTVAATIVALTLFPEQVFALLGRDASLTGRTDIWAALLEAINVRPWTGYGYGVFWQENSEPAYWIRRAVNWTAPSAHNGWLEVCIAIGIGGVVLVALDLFTSLVRSAFAFRAGWGGIFCAGFLLQYVLFSASESMILQQNTYLWLVYVIVAGRLAVDEGIRAGERRRSGRLLPGGLHTRLAVKP